MQFDLRVQLLHHGLLERDTGVAGLPFHHFRAVQPHP
jgi:hypothetical protein